MINWIRPRNGGRKLLEELALEQMAKNHVNAPVMDFDLEERKAKSGTGQEIHFESILRVRATRPPGSGLKLPPRERFFKNSKNRERVKWKIKTRLNSAKSTTCWERINIPAERYYGIHTQRALRNFPITGVPISHFPELIKSLAYIKKAAALANNELEQLAGQFDRGHMPGMR